MDIWCWAGRWPPVWEVAAHLAVAWSVLLCAVLFSQEMPWMRSGTELSQLLTIFLPTATLQIWIISIHPKVCLVIKSRKENPQKLTQLSSRSHPRHLVGKRTAQKDITIDTTSDSQVNSNFSNRWSPASLIFNNYFYQ